MNNDSYEQHVIESFKVICLCKSVKKGSILKAIKEGCTNLSDINRKLGTGSGDCHGERCQDKIRQILNEVT
ncbi:MAG: (2Fe-2S)-binding protein [Proteobacteria bacterium]|nr:(2Fe-2S)-binding protein [Pseudomonadota bacterium]